MIRSITTVCLLSLTCAMAFSQEPVPKKTSPISTEETDLAALIHSYDAAWNSHDPNKLADLWVPEGDLITPWGRWILGKEQIIKYLDVLKSKSYEKSIMFQSIDLTRALTKEIAIVDTTIRITGVNSPYQEEGTPLIQHGVYVAAKISDKWMIVSNRIFMFQSRPIE
jgi:uncharacterized protein (TIGR02246 family)